MCKRVSKVVVIGTEDVFRLTMFGLGGTLVQVVRSLGGALLHVRDGLGDVLLSMRRSLPSERGGLGVPVSSRLAQARLVLVLGNHDGRGVLDGHGAHGDRCR